MTFEQTRRHADCVRGVPLQRVLARVGAERDPQDPAKWKTSQGVLSVNGTKFMNWKQGFGGGGAIDLAMHLKGMGFKDAVAWLSCHFPTFIPSETDTPAPRPLKLPERDARKLTCVREYLLDQRRLPSSLLESLIQHGTLYADHRGNAVFVLLGKENRPVAAELRGTTSTPWRGMAPGSRKDLGYFSIPHSNSQSIVLCESAIDAISCFALHPESLCLSTSGARPNPRWLASWVRRKERTIYCGFDADPTGDEMARAMIRLHPAIKRLRPPFHDWNDVLRSRTES